MSSFTFLVHLCHRIAREQHFITYKLCAAVTQSLKYINFYRSTASRQSPPLASLTRQPSRIENWLSRGARVKFLGHLTSTSDGYGSDVQQTARSRLHAELKSFGTNSNDDGKGRQRNPFFYKFPTHNAIQLSCEMKPDSCITISLLGPRSRGGKYFICAQQTKNDESLIWENEMQFCKSDETAVERGAL